MTQSHSGQVTALTTTRNPIQLVQARRKVCFVLTVLTKLQAFTDLLNLALQASRIRQCLAGCVTLIL